MKRIITYLLFSIFCISLNAQVKPINGQGNTSSGNPFSVDVQLTNQTDLNDDNVNEVNVDQSLQAISNVLGGPFRTRVGTTVSDYTLTRDFTSPTFIYTGRRLSIGDVDPDLTSFLHIGGKTRIDGELILSGKASFKTGLTAASLLIQGSADVEIKAGSTGDIDFLIDDDTGLISFPQYSSLSTITGAVTGGWGRGANGELIPVESSTGININYSIDTVNSVKDTVLFSSDIDRLTYTVTATSAVISLPNELAEPGLTVGDEVTIKLVANPDNATSIEVSGVDFSVTVDGAVSDNTNFPLIQNAVTYRYIGEAEYLIVSSHKN